MTPLFDAPKLLDLDKVVRSTINPRRRFNEASLVELANNIRRHGVLQPILCRPTQMAGQEYFEIVAGERRWRASGVAAQPQIPAIVREMNDAEALEIAVIENAQREDLHPLEEAEGFEALLRAYGHTESDASSADDLAAKIGKSRTHIYNRLKLLQLIPDLRDAFFKDEFNATVAQQLARLPAKMQPKAFAALRKAAVDGETINVKESAKLLRAQFHLRMDRATFPIDDAGLLSGAPACTKCPKMSGNEPDLFGDEPDNVCTDGDCFQSKKLAFNERIKDKAREAGLEVIEGEAARPLLKFGTVSDELNGDYVYMDRGLPNLTGSDKSLARLLGTLLKPSALFEHPKDHTLREIVQVTKAIASLRSHELLINDPDKDRPKAKKPKGDGTTTVATKPDTSRMEPSEALQPSGWDEPEDDEAAAELAKEHQWREAAFRQLHAALHNNDSYLEAGLRMVAQELCEQHLDTDGQAWLLMCDLWGWKPVSNIMLYDQISLNLAEMNAGQLLILLTELAALPDVFVDTPQSNKATNVSNLVALCEEEEIDVDWAGLRRQAEFGELSGSDLPHVSPARAGEALSRANQGGDKSPPEDSIQAPQGAQTKEESQLPHWVGQKVRIKGAKTIGEINVVFSDGALEVATPAGEEGVRNLHRYASHEVQVLPGQTRPEGVVHWPFPVPANR